MTTAEFNAMKTRYQFAESVLNENPDKVYDSGDLLVAFNHEDARSFG